MAWWDKNAANYHAAENMQTGRKLAAAEERIRELEEDVEEARSQGAEDYAGALILLMVEAGVAKPPGGHTSVEVAETMVKGLLATVFGGHDA